MSENGKKALIRDAVRTRRAMLEPELVKYYGEVLSEQFLESDDEELVRDIKACNCIAVYSSVRGEIPCDGIAKYFMDKGATVCYPRVNGSEMEFYKVTDVDAQMTKGAYNIPEPNESATKVDSSEIDIMIVPAIAFNDEGIRLGQGGGYYDKYISKASSKGKVPLLVGACYDFQIYSALPVEAHDIAVDVIMCVYTGEDE